MPLMMDDDMEMDDLFGDGGGLALPSQPPTKELYQRVDEMRGGGACQHIAWSKWGSIASIAPNGTSLELRNLACDPADGTWALTEPTITTSASPALEGGPFRHVSWSPTGSELAVIDSVGRVTILAIFSTLNKSELKRPAQFDPVDDLHRIIGTFWLHIPGYSGNRTKILNGPAVKEGSTYRYEASSAPTLGPSVPTPNRSALVCVTTNGMIRLIYPQINGKWYESHVELESIVSSDDLITHASICPDKTGNLLSLLVAFATSTGQLRVVRVAIEWYQTKINEKEARSTPINPVMKTRHVAATTWSHKNVIDPLNVDDYDSQMTALSHLEILPICIDAQGKPTPPTILTFRSHMPSSISSYSQDVYTVSDRWELREKAQSLHSAFEQLSSRRNSIGSQPSSIQALKKVEGFTTNKIFLSIQQINYGRVIFLAYSDGTIEHRDRWTMQETFNDGDYNKVWHLSQIGFTYTDEEPCTHVALSPSWCSVVASGTDNKMTWRRLDSPLGDIGQNLADPQYAAVVAALALSCSTAVMRNVNYDDILATAHKHNNSNLCHDWTMELSRLVKLVVDYTEETHNEALIRNATIQLTLSIQNSLGFHGEFRSRSFSGKLAWIILQLRNIVVLVTVASNVRPGSNNESTSPLDDPEVVDLLSGSVRWVLDLVAWIMDTLITLPDTLPSHISITDIDKLSLTELLQHLRSTNIISLHLLLSSAARGFLTAICRRLAHLDYIARRAMQRSATTPQVSSTGQTPPSQQSSSLSPALQAAYTQIATLTSTSIIRIKTIENLLLSLSTRVKTAYAATNTTTAATTANGAQRSGGDPVRNLQEMEMLYGGAFPECFKAVIIELYRKDGGLLESVRNEIDPAKLFFANFDVLEIDEDVNTVKARKAKNRTMDSLKKNWLSNPSKGGDVVAAKGNSNGKQWRRCARCAAVMEDVTVSKQALQWLLMQQRRCFCGGYWYTLGLKDGTA